MSFINELRNFFAVRIGEAFSKICGPAICETEFFKFHLFGSPTIEWTSERTEMLITVMSAAEAEFLRKTLIRNVGNESKIDVFLGFTPEAHAFYSTWLQSCIVTITEFPEDLERVVLGTLNSKILFHGNRDDMMDFETRTRLLWEIWNVADPDFP